MYAFIGIANHNLAIYRTPNTRRGIRVLHESRLIPRSFGRLTANQYYAVEYCALIVHTMAICNSSKIVFNSSRNYTICLCIQSLVQKISNRVLDAHPTKLVKVKLGTMNIREKQLNQIKLFELFS